MTAETLLRLLAVVATLAMPVAAAAQSDFERQRISQGGELALDRHAVTAALAADRARPIDGQHLPLDLLGAHARRVGRADERAHAGANDAVDGNVQLVENA